MLFLPSFPPSFHPSFSTVLQSSFTSFLPTSVPLSPSFLPLHLYFPLYFLACLFPSFLPSHLISTVFLSYQGKPVLVVHGGPGGGTDPVVRTYMKYCFFLSFIIIKSLIQFLYSNIPPMNILSLINALP